jgi:hypothetical protein
VYGESEGDRAGTEPGDRSEPNDVTEAKAND